jgi:hypothetical protein
MTGARFPQAFGRAQAGPLQVSIPSRLPGGLWGPQPISGVVEWDAQGDPSVRKVSLQGTSQSLLQTEWPIPTRWELQLGLALTCLNGSQAFNGATGSFNLRGAIVSSVESAEVSQAVELVFGPGVYPLVAAVNGVLGLGSTFAVVGQTVRVRFDRIDLAPDRALASTRWAWTVQTVCGLTSAGWPSP